MSNPDSVCHPHAHITSEQSRAARARAWAFVFQCWQGKRMAAERAPAPDGHDAATRVEKKEGVTV